MKGLLAGFLMLAGFFSAEAADWNFRSGPALATAKIEGTETSLSGWTVDVYRLSHRKYISWGLGLKNLSAGMYRYTGGDVLLGYYSDKTNMKKVSWHISIAGGLGILSGLPSGYSKLPAVSSAAPGKQRLKFPSVSGRGGMNFGINYLVKPPKDGSKSFLALTFDLDNGRIGQEVFTSANIKTDFNLDYYAPMLGLIFYW
ncbi:MAG: hypothetical protein HYY86_02475 [Candidatus Harrisonbacteria bacterium]|nr:hypothetical protein [Candidatus Harrisonbacteria bacterium]